MLRGVSEEDLPVFFEHQQDDDAQRLAASPGREWDAFVAHWRTRVLAEPSSRVRSVELNGRVAGYVMCWEHGGKCLIAYWFGKEYWGRGVATAALAEFLTAHEDRRPLYAYVACANVGSFRVLEKCGFQVPGTSTTGADGVEEVLFRLGRQPRLAPHNFSGETP
jgi:RimJ/RimL family protein N-acetyltransferase